MDDQQYILETVDNLISIPERLIALRKRYRITQSELAKELGYARQQVSQDEIEMYSNASTVKIRRTLIALLKLIEQKTDNTHD